MWEKSGYIGEKADIFSLGALLFNLVTGIFGFKTSKKNDSFYKYIISHDIERYWNSINDIIKFDLSQEFKDLYIQMVSYNPSERPTIAEILESEWMKEINNLNKIDSEKLENEVKDILNNLYNELKISNEGIRYTDKLESEGYVTG